MISINELMYKNSIIIDYLEYHNGHNYRLYNHLCPDEFNEPDSDIVHMPKTLNC